MKIKAIFFVFILINVAYLQINQDSLGVKKKTGSKAPIIISTLPFLNNEPEVTIALTSLLLAIENNDTLSKDLNNPNKALFLSSLSLLNLVSDNELLYTASLGQIYNKKYLKAFIMSTMKTYWLSEYHNSKKDDIKDRNRSLWWLLVLILYGMADAYVDAHFNQEIKLENNNGEKK